jgi:predicted transposase/invertase (TIGR01784 family)
MLKIVSEGERKRAILRNRRIQQADHESNMITVRREGIKEGIKEGIIEGEKTKAVAIAKNLLDMGLPVDKIIMATELTLEEVQGIIKEKAQN